MLLQKTLQALPHLLMCQEFAALQRCFSLDYRFAKAIVFEKPQRGIFHQTLGLCSGLNGKLCKMRFLLGCKVKLHIITL